MGGIVDTVKGVFGGTTKAEKAAGKASKQQLQAQREALDYLKEREALPQEFREGALTQLAGLYGLEPPEGFEGEMLTQQDLIDQAMASPIYQAIMGTQEAGEEAIMRQAGMTGGLRSGNVQSALANQAQQIENQALLSAYTDQLSGLQGLANLPSNASQIAAQMAGLGATQAQGTMGQDFARQQGIGTGLGAIGSIANIGATLAPLFGFSDRRLKKNIVLIGYNSGLPVYRFEWNSSAKKFGLEGGQIGFVAQEVERKYPDSVVEIDGYKRIKLDFLQEVEAA